MRNPRRDFLGWLGASAALAAVGSPLAAERAPAAPGQGGPVSDKWDMSWVERVRGKSRAVFDATEVGEGSALFRAVMWRKQMKEVYAAGDADTTAVIVFRHAAIPLVVDDAYWERFNVGKETKLKDGKTKKWTKVNPIRATAADTPARFADYSLEKFMAQGGIVLACNMAFGEIVSRFQKEDKLSRDEAEKRAREHLIPGVILQPSGVFATLKAEDAGCHYILAS